MNIGSKKGFTLAEVLITLTIIGVIAAITIPNLMQSYKKHQVEVSVKEAYSIILNALNMAKTEHGDWNEMTEAANKQNGAYSQARYFGENYLKPYLKIQKFCQAAVWCDILPYDRVKLLNGTTENTAFGNPDGYRMLLSNGMYIAEKRSNNCYMFLVDINAAKGPNRAGYDVFYFNLMPPDYWNYYKAEFNATGSCEGSRQNNPGKRECSVKGADCAYFIQKNGWKIPDNYPVKKF